MPRPPSPASLAELKASVGEAGWLQQPADIEPFLSDHRRLYHGVTPLVLLPNTTAQVASILRICHREEIAVVPHGGNTSYCGAATPDSSNTQLVLGMKRLRRVRSVDPADYAMIVEAGVTLAQAQAAAADVGRLFPLSLGSEGTAQIGGNVSTNAGGTAVLRYGMMRDLVFGLEVVLADGRVIHGLKKLRKDNTGYDVKSVFIGAEGTLGVITAAALKLFPRPEDSATAVVAVESPQRALELLAFMRAAAGDQVTTFELMPRFPVELTVRLVADVCDPTNLNAAYYLLVEWTSAEAADRLSSSLSSALERAAAQGIIQDAILATSSAQAQTMWKLRENIPEAQRRHGASLKHDISVPVSAIPALIERGTAIVQALVPDGDLVGYGHAGDGNLHFNVSQRPGTDRGAFLARGRLLETAIFDLVGELGGSISAEHGIGRLKVEALAQRTDPVELAVMRDLKRALDPKGILNPGKVLA